MSRPVIEGGLVVGKFGGTSMANAAKFRNAAEIVLANSSRRVTTVSAPGNDENNPAHDFRVTQALKAGRFNQVWDRFDGIASDLFGQGDERYRRITEAIDDSRRGVQSRDRAYAESRGEYLSGKIFAELIGATFVDPSKIVKLESDGAIHPDTYTLIPQYITDSGLFVVPGYFGTNVNTGEIETLGPGSTDKTGSILSKGTGATLYENWTDVDGVLAADPRLFPKPKRDDIRVIGEIEYDEMGELSFRGAGVLQVDAVEPARDAGIPINIRNSQKPKHPGTMVVAHRIAPEDEQIIGIASGKGFVSIGVSEPGMDKKKGVIAQLGTIFAENNVSLEQGPGGRDNVSFIFHSSHLENGTSQKVMREIREAIPDSELAVTDNIGLVSIVGKGIAKDATGINATMYTALRKSHIRTGAHIQAEEPLSIVFSVANPDVRRTVKTLYKAFIL